jgi:hypothetical protein
MSIPPVAESVGRANGVEARNGLERSGGRIGIPRTALSIQQPWAFLILRGGKNIENRRWKTSYRGRIVVHAGKTLYPGEEQQFHELQHLHGPLPLGAFVGEVTLVDCVSQEKALQRFPGNEWAWGPWCWILKDPIVYCVPMPGRGMPGLFPVPWKELDQS